MDSTHYFPARRPVTADEWARIVGAAERIVKMSPVPLAGSTGERGTSPVVSETMVAFNGVGDDAGHAFVLAAPDAERDLLPALDPTQAAFHVCRTEERPYDTVVKAVLAAVEHIAPGAFAIMSDHAERHWHDGLELASAALGCKVPFPIHAGHRD
ncbi:Uncharacterized protein PBTT_05547 [Plasmodiophora brassicae]|uniref:Uncharacterized protein n=1 Tax=Plasmodiophora brassicae TaxID=37360 RepID=A0A3P3YBV9_PLABS|nr:unnamed protein product [Plasmodiophora brassicae]